MAKRETKAQLLEMLENLKNQVNELDEMAQCDVTKYDEITAKNSVDEIKKAISQAKKDLKFLENAVDDEIEQSLEKDGKKKVFKWSKLSGYYALKLQDVTPEKIKVGYKISFRLDKEKIAKIDDYFYYNDKKRSAFSSISFENGQDICTVKSIDENGEIKAVSSKNGGTWYIVPDDINGKKSSKCVIKDGSNIAFLVYAPKEK